MVSNPLFGRLSDRTTSRLGMRRPWMLVGLAGGVVGTLTVALAPNIGVVLVGWCIAQVFLNALLAAQVAVLPDQVPCCPARRRLRRPRRLPAGGLGGRHLPGPGVRPQPADDVPGAVRRGRASSCCVRRRRSTTGASTRRASRRGRCGELVGSFYVDPRTHRGLRLGVRSAGSCSSWPTRSWSPTRPTTCWSSSAVREGDVPHQIYLGTLAQSVALVVTAPLAGRLSDRVGRRKVFVMVAAVIYAVAMVVIATADGFGGYLVGMAVGGLGFGDVHGRRPRPRRRRAARRRARRPRTSASSTSPARCPSRSRPPSRPPVLGAAGGSYAALYLVAAGACALPGPPPSSRCGASANPQPPHCLRSSAG